MPHLVSVLPLDDFRLSVRFDDGIQGVAELRDRLFGPVFEPLRDPALFREVFIDAFGAIAWPSGADLAPDWLYERIRSSKQLLSETSS